MHWLHAGNYLRDITIIYCISDNTHDLRLHTASTSNLNSAAVIESRIGQERDNKHAKRLHSICILLILSALLIMVFRGRENVGDLVFLVRQFRFGYLYLLKGQCRAIFYLNL